MVPLLELILVLPQVLTRATRPIVVAVTKLKKIKDYSDPYQNKIQDLIMADEDNNSQQQPPVMMEPWLIAVITAASLLGLLLLIVMIYFLVFADGKASEGSSKKPQPVVGLVQSWRRLGFAKALGLGGSASSGNTQQYKSVAQQ